MTKRCSGCGYFQRAQDPKLAHDYGKCTLEAEGAWFSPDHPACPKQVAQTPQQRRLANWIVIVVAADIALLPLLLWLLLIAWRPAIFSFPVWAVYALVAFAYLILPFGVLYLTIARLRRR
ncbi:MAG: hypothetical protein M0031_11570 [Thermaerobacter sp.]|jgi:hypothetical protein|nr:hypothetical protein [Thermaerobacter sp.]